MKDSMGSLPDVTVKPEEIKPVFYPRRFYTEIRSRHAMKISNQTAKKIYTEAEAAEFIGVSLLHLRTILDQNVFNDGVPRPDNVLIEGSDLVLLEFWCNLTPNPKVVRMPRRPR